MEQELSLESLKMVYWYWVGEVEKDQKAARHSVCMRNKAKHKLDKAERKKGYADKLAAEHGKAILTWLVRGCVDWQKAGSLGEPEAVRQAVAEYRDQQDILHDYLIERCIFQKDATLDQKTLYADYKQWAENKGSPDKWRDYWLAPESKIIHFIGKGILFHHALFWPTILKNANYKPPKLVDVETDTGVVRMYDRPGLLTKPKEPEEPKEKKELTPLEKYQQKLARKKIGILEKIEKGKPVSRADSALVYPVGALGKKPTPTITKPEAFKTQGLWNVRTEGKKKKQKWYLGEEEITEDDYKYYLEENKRIRLRQRQIALGGPIPPETKETPITATNPETGEKLILRDGQWMPQE